MAIFIFKVLAVVIRTTAKPLISWATYYNRIKLQENPKNVFIKERIIWLGQMTNYYNAKFNRLVFRLSPNEPIKKLTDDKAIEKGSEFFSEILIYAILLAIPILEWLRQYKLNKIKNEILDNGIKRMRIDIELMLKENERKRSELEELKNYLESLKRKI
jgi:hypothetical protein